MEAKLADGCAYCIMAVGVALVLYGVVSSFADAETIREYAELNALVVAGLMGALSLV